MFAEMFKIKEIAIHWNNKRGQQTNFYERGK